MVTVLGIQHDLGPRQRTRGGDGRRPAGRRHRAGSFAIVGSIALVSGRAIDKTRYTVGGPLLVLALAAGLLLILHPAATCASR